jgi:hypothetical protein
MKKSVNTLLLTLLSGVLLASFVLAPVVDARERGGGGGKRDGKQNVKAGDSKRDSRGGKRDVEINNSKRDVRTTNVRNTSVNKVNVDRSTNVDIDIDRRHGGWDYDDHHHHPIATAAAVTATAVVTAAVVGSVVHTIPPSCTTVVVNGLAYQQCGSTWYQPQYVGSQVQYVVIAPLR